MHFVVILLCLVWMSVPAACGETAPPELNLENLFGKPRFSSKSYSAHWDATGDAYLRVEDSEVISGGQDIVAYDASSGERRIVVPASDLVPDQFSKPIRIESFQFSADMSMVLIYTNSQRVWRQNTRGDYWVVDCGSHQLTRVAQEAGPAQTMFAKFSPDKDHVAYVRDGDIYVDNLLDRTTVRLTKKEHRNIINGTFDWTYEEEFGLRDGFRWSPDGKRIAYWRLDTSHVPTFTMINNTDSLYPKTIQFAHSKVGQRNASCSIRVIEIDTRAETKIEAPGDPGENYIARMQWMNDQTLVLHHLNRLQNRLTLLSADVRSGQTETILIEQDDAWVDVHDETFWFPNGERFTWVSERDGWRRPYLIDLKGSHKSLTRGPHDAIEVLGLDPQQNLYYIASPENAAQRYLYRVNARTGGAVERVTPSDQPGSHSYSLSPNGKWAIHTYSSAGVPPAIKLVRLADHAVVRTLEDNQELKEKLDRLKLAPVEFFQVPADDGQLMDAWCIEPPSMAPSRKYPLLVYVYGEPAGSTVTDRWGGNRYLHHQLLAQKGYVVMSFDNRGTKVPRGRAWRKSIYRRVGVLAPRDQASAVREVLAKRRYLDKDRVGIWGWSGGGSMSLNAIFKYPELYKTAISIAPVPNQRYYDTIYQERYMGLPHDNLEGYFEGSAINFAKQLQGNLLLIHGTGDDNCHYQTMELLINELIRHNKQFSMMAYPNRTHSIREGTNTTLHLRTLMTRFLEANL